MLKVGKKTLLVFLLIFFVSHIILREGKKRNSLRKRHFLLIYVCSINFSLILTGKGNDEVSFLSVELSLEKRFIFVASNYVLNLTVLGTQLFLFDIWRPLDREEFWVSCSVCFL